MLVFRILFIIILVYVCPFSTTAATTAAKRICADPKCSQAISHGTTTQNYVGRDKEHLSFPIGADVVIYSKSADPRNDLWGVVINGKRGFVPKRFLKELKVLVKHPNYTISTEEEVSIEKKDDNSSKEGTTDAPQLSLNETQAASSNQSQEISPSQEDTKKAVDSASPTAANDSLPKPKDAVVAKAPPTIKSQEEEIKPTPVPSDDDYTYLEGTKLHRSLLAQDEPEKQESPAKPSSKPTGTFHPFIAPSSPTKSPQVTSTEVDLGSKEEFVLDEALNAMKDIPKHLISEESSDSQEDSTEQPEPPKVTASPKTSKKEESIIPPNETTSEKNDLPEKIKVDQEVVPDPKPNLKEEPAVTSPPSTPLPVVIEKDKKEEPQQPSKEEKPSEKLEEELPKVTEQPPQRITDPPPVVEQTENRDKEETKDNKTAEEDSEQEKEVVSKVESTSTELPPEIPEPQAYIDNSSLDDTTLPPQPIGSELPEKVTNRVETDTKEPPLVIEEELKVEAEGADSLPFFIHSLRSQLQMVLDLLPEAIQLAIIDLKVSPHMVVFSACFTIFFLSLSIACVAFDKRGELQRLSIMVSQAEQQMFTLLTERDSYKKDLELYRTKVTSHSNTFQTMKQSLDQELESSKATTVKLQTLVDSLTAQNDDYFQLNEQLENERNQALAQNLHLTELNDTLSAKLASVEKELVSLTEKYQDLEESHTQLDLESGQLKTNCDQLLEEARIWDSRVKELDAELSNNRDLLNKTSTALKEREMELKGLQRVMQELNNPDSQEDGPLDSQEVKEKLAKILDVGILKERVKELETELETMVIKLGEKEAQIQQLEGEMAQVKEELQDLQKEHSTVLQERTDAQNKLATLSAYFKQKEVELQKELGFEQIKRQQKETDATDAERSLECLERENENYKEQLTTLRKELEESTRHFKMKISEEQKKTHDIMMSLRSAERKLEEAEREAHNLRQRMTLLEKEHTNKLKSMLAQNVSEVGSITQQSDDSLELGARPGALPAGRPMPPLPFVPPAFTDGRPNLPPPQFFGERPPFPGGGDPWAYRTPVPMPPFPPPHFPYERPPVPPPGRMTSPPLFDTRMGSGRFHKGKVREEPRFTSPRPNEDLPHRHTPPSGSSPMPRRGVYPIPPDPRTMIPSNKFQPIQGNHPTDRGHRLPRRERPDGPGREESSSSSQRSPTNSQTSPKEDMV